MHSDAAKTLPELFRAAVKQYAKNTACLYRPRFRTLRWTYEELWSHAIAYSEILRKRGVGKGDRVILISQNSPFWVAAFFSIQLKGAAAVPLFPESNQKLVEEICRQTSPKVILRGAVAEVQKVSGYEVLQLEEVEKPAIPSEIDLNVEVSEDDLAEIVYTSGTTGFPKGAMLTHKNLLSNLRAVKDVIKIDSGFKLVSILPLFHMFEQMGGMLVPVSVGAQISYSASLNPNHLKRIFEDDKPNIMLAVPEFLRLIYLRLREKAKKEGKLALLEKMLKIVKPLPLPLRRKVFGNIHRAFGWKLHTIVSGGAPLEKEVGDFWEGIGIYILQGYGLTETSPVLTTNRYRDRKIDSVGKPLKNVEIKIADDGEVLARGSSVFAGYWQKEAKTKEAFDDDGWFLTGDIGYFDKRGHLFLRGRKDHMIVLRTGEKVHPEDLERELNKEADVLDSAVLGVRKAGEVKVVAVLLMKEPSLKKAKEAIKRVNERLLPHQQIKETSVWPYEDFPRTPTKKVKKYEVLEEIKKLQTQRGEEVSEAPASKLESIIAQVTGIAASKIEDSQLLSKDLSLDSLGRIELVARIEIYLNVSVDENEITDKISVKDLKEIVAKKKHKRVRYEFNPKIFSSLARIFRAVFQPLILFPLTWIFAPMKVYGRNMLKKIEKPFLFYSNHLSMADGAVIYAALPARVRRKLVSPAATDVVYEKQSFGWKILRFILEYIFLVLPFDREGQVKSSFEYMARALDKGYCVLLFPEGQISRDGHLGELKKGAALVAKEMGVPVIPIKLEGTRSIIDISQKKEGRLQFPQRARVSVSFGESFRVNQDKSDEDVLEEIEKRMQSV